MGEMSSPKRRIETDVSLSKQKRRVGVIVRILRLIYLQVMK